MLFEETQNSIALFPIYSKNLDVSRVGDFLWKRLSSHIGICTFSYCSNSKRLLFLLKILNRLYCSNVMVFCFVNVLIQPCYNIITQNSFSMLWLPVCLASCGFSLLMFWYSLCHNTITQNSYLMLWLPVCLASCGFCELMFEQLMQRALTSMKWL